LGESKEVAIVREVKEETGLDFTVISWLEKIYDTKNRDPRGDATSYVAYGYVEGFTQHEPGKTEVVFLSREDVLKQKNSFAFDHFEIFTDFLSSVSLC
jgi:ADP-ribose pyrophosphatase YjhB (NUDIX family)